MKKLILFLFPLLLLCGSFVSCSDGGDGTEEQQQQEEQQQEEKLVKNYSYKFNCELKNSKTNETKNFHRVNEYHSIDNADGTQTARVYKSHYFSTENTSYVNLTGEELVNLVKSSKVEGQKTSKTVSDELKVKKSDTEIIIVPAGLEYVVYYYF